MNEQHRVDGQAIGLVLARAPDDRTERVYNRTQHLNRWRELALKWANFLPLTGAKPCATLVGQPP
jgi:hypothetical protein